MMIVIIIITILCCHSLFGKHNFLKLKWQKSLRTFFSGKRAILSLFGAILSLSFLFLDLCSKLKYQEKKFDINKSCFWHFSLFLVSQFYTWLTNFEIVSLYFWGKKLNLFTKKRKSLYNFFHPFREKTGKETLNDNNWS